MFSQYFKLALNNLGFILGKADLLSIRLVLSLGSLCWGLMWLHEYMDPQSFFAAHYTTYTLLNMFPAALWASAYIVHFVSSFAGLLFKCKSKWMILFDNVLGALLWTGSSSLMLFVYWGLAANPPAALLTHMMVSMFSLWLLVRTPYGR
jgi:hypothetical protein